MEIVEIKVGIADLNVTKSPNKIITVGLGSCIGIALYDKVNKIAGLAHIMLPNSTQFTKVTNPLKFADLAIPILIDKMKEKGANTRSLKAKIAGGASMFKFSDKSMIMDIGNRNAKAVKEKLKSLSIPILSEDTGGNNGRTMIIDALDGVVQIKTVGKGIKEI
ncbi:chemoreceptor glutamine deamidase CheD [Clostridium acetireducens DSM 10703]|jgi:chemotaxis protein CheD|uniref:Probable chemoreceptor glutamine deamidase CheD n=1 Tax=Clostridium acetireducens DSM 10703 TaxID=1121290 RepID=A0A1E8EZG5_9CLOT|nr:chemotaxis protein CheD [Clostridium acetireducens]OFI06521.1 chemoreceptor glutamine deamidase CheD [Clostridium acetireducens DSM 10703]